MDGERGGLGPQSPNAEVAVDAPVYILYFQGPLLRASFSNRNLQLGQEMPRLCLPGSPGVMRKLRDARCGVCFTTSCLTYWSYWTPGGRLSEKSFNVDAEAALRWIGR